MTKMKSRAGRIVFYALLTLMACMILLIVKTEKVQAASKTYYYVGSFMTSDKYHTGGIKKAYLKGNKIVIKGSLRRFTPKNYKTYTNATYLKSKTRKFKLTKSTKYKEGSGYSGWYNVPKSQFDSWIKSLSKSHNGLGFVMKVKNEKVVWMRTSP